MTMKNKSFWLDDKTINRLAAVSKSSGIPQAVIVRAAIRRICETFESNTVEKATAIVFPDDSDGKGN